jgi:Arylsulfotransferase (ASST)
LRREKTRVTHDLALTASVALLACCVAAGPSSAAAPLNGEGKATLRHPSRGLAYVCRGAAGSREALPAWMTKKRWVPGQKPAVAGNVRWLQASFTRTPGDRGFEFSSNALPVGGGTGEFPAPPDLAAAHPEADRTITPHHLTGWIPAVPRARKHPRCLSDQPIGIAMNGVPILAPSDAAGQDLAARQVGDACRGVVTRDGLYAYRLGSPCLDAAAFGQGAGGQIGWARDGFPIVGPRGRKGKLLRDSDLDTCHGRVDKVKVGGRVVRRYRYHQTAEFPYLIGCFRGTPRKWGLGAGGAAGRRTVRVAPSTDPAPDPAVSDYVVRCNGAGVHVDISTAPGESAILDGEGPFAGSLSRDLPLAEGQEFTYSFRRRGVTESHFVRCLPGDFPTWTYERTSRPHQPYYLFGSLVAPGSAPAYVILVDDNGVPVWWLKDTSAPSVVDAKILSGGTIAWSRYFGGTFSTNPSSAYEIRRLDGSLVRQATTTGSATDSHDLQELPNGDLLLVTYVPRDHVDISSLGGPSDATVVDGEIQEVDPQGNVVWSWNSADHIALSESQRWAGLIATSPVMLPDGRTAYDIVHLNSIDPVGDDRVLVSLGYTDALYMVDRSTGDIIWKLGGTSRPESLDIVGDPYASADFGLQHDGRVLPDGTVTVHDDGVNRMRPPRAVRYQIDESAGTATLMESIGDPDVLGAFCCGSARREADGSWFIDWGSNPIIGEYQPDGTPIFRMRFAPGSFSYRAIPIAPGVLSASGLRVAMDAMFPR